MSYQSSTESPEEGYGSLKTSHITQENLRNNAKNTQDHPKVAGVGTNVNHIHHKNVNLMHTNSEEAEDKGESETTTPSSDSGASPSTEKQLFMLLHRTRLQERVKERTSSSRSVTSIEMDGDNLVVVTEEVDDNAFADDDLSLEGATGTELVTDSQHHTSSENGVDSRVGDGDMSLDGATRPCELVTESLHHTSSENGGGVDSGVGYGDMPLDGAMGACESVTESRHHTSSENGGGVDSGVGDGELEDISASSDSTYPSPTGDKYHKMLAELQADMKQNEKEEQRRMKELEAAADVEVCQISQAASESVTQAMELNGVSDHHTDTHSKPINVEKLKESLNLKLTIGEVADPPMLTPDISITGSPGGMSSSSGSTSGPDSRPPSPITPPPFMGSMPHTPNQLTTDPSYESLVGAMNMQFPNNCVSYGRPNTPGSEKKSAKEQICGVFSVDIGKKHPSFKYL